MELSVMIIFRAVRYVPEGHLVGRQTLTDRFIIVPQERAMEWRVITIIRAVLPIEQVNMIRKHRTGGKQTFLDMPAHSYGPKIL